MERYMKLRDARDALTIALMTSNKSMIDKASKHLKMLRKTYGLDD